MPIYGGKQTSELVPGALNSGAGLQRWRNSLGRCKKNSVGTGMGGVDVVALGDSILKGTGSTDHWRDGVLHRLKVMLQSKYNPPGVVGGYGYAPASDGKTTAEGYGSGTTGSSNFGISLFQATATYVEYTDDDSGVGARKLLLRNNSDDAQLLGYYNLTGSVDDAEQRRLKVDSFDVVYGTDPSYGTLSVDVGNGSYPARGGGVPTLSVSQASAVAFGARTAVTGVTATNNVRVALRPPAGSTTQCSVDGLILYYGDRNCGVRVHNCSNSGSRVVDYGVSAQSASIDQFALATGSGAQYAGLFILDWIINDVNNGTPLAQYRDALTTVVERCLAQPSAPAVLLMIPPRPSGTTVSQWNPYKDVMLSLAMTHSDVVALDFEALFGTADGTDFTHNSDVRQAAMAEALFSLLTT